MAPPITNHPKLAKEEDDNIWSSVLCDVHTSSSSKFPNGKSLIVLGNNETGKTTLIARLEANEVSRKGAGLEYHVIDVQDEYGDDTARLGVWLLDGNPQHTNLFRYMLTKENLGDTLVLLTASMAQPWAIMDTLDTWCSLLQHHINGMGLDNSRLRECRQKLTKTFQEYVEPDDREADIMTASLRQRTTLSPLADDDTLPLGDGVLTLNLGVPVLIVVTKSDAMLELERESDYRDEHFDYIQQQVRNFALSLGAGIVYVSVKENKNCELLYKYLLHRIYDVPFDLTANVVERDGIFIPCGWDNEKKIAILTENFTTLQADGNYCEVIPKPLVRRVSAGGAAVAVLERQSFAVAVDVSKAVSGPGSETVLANFFNSLLTKKQGPAGATEPGASVESDQLTPQERRSAVLASTPKKSSNQ
ncbi:PREDICTED: cytoplasmic dynein 1 light intermediate chain 2-like [Priapulus caudatus]|uniref:Dynein light intermediate chain n=1 Tax=Priapulus caudatus TaxID=37621 RepID=A0ABM1EY04_PRICU|nr:PREDICTED: cytoplasmic dynein 1 light intermediate chain 2-like [Priapulus caudatus]